MEQFAPWIDATLPSVTRAMAREWWTLLCARRSSSVRYGPGKPLAAQTLRNVLNLVRKAFDDALEDELISANPFSGLKVHRSRGARTTEASTVVELHERELGLAALPYPERWIVEFALITGIRQGEQWSLTLDDLHLDHPTPHCKVRFGSEDGPTKAGRVHTVWIFGLALKAARAWLVQLDSYAPSNPLGLVFPTRSGKRRPPSGVFRSFSRFGQAIGRKVRWHDLRHSALTALAGGWDGPEWRVEAIRLQADHSSVVVTERYVRLAQSLARNAAAQMPNAELAVRLPEKVHRGHPVRGARRFRGAIKHRGAIVEKNNVDAATAVGENASNGAVAKWSGIGLQNRESPPEGGDHSPQDAVSRALKQAQAERDLYRADLDRCLAARTVAASAALDDMTQQRDDARALHAIVGRELARAQGEALALRATLRSVRTTGERLLAAAPPPKSERGCPFDEPLGLLGASPPVPIESFRATELADVPPGERVTRPELVDDADDGEERALLHLGREQLLALVKERTAERDAERVSLANALGVVELREKQTAQALDRVVALEERENATRAALRTATGLLTDVDKLSERISAFLDLQVKA